ncbi:Lipid A biosynthesis lauroyl acyltransferase [hydrothermal vent metagenome]|uniref:Lipid A biosynthesis lauroyl acyltransferase n=1 Tax=hydrothermal vent metagenome TaxID=652676 RepID=A0A3B1CC49_9ZZZZ
MKKGIGAKLVYFIVLALALYLRIVPRNIALKTGALLSWIYWTVLRFQDKRRNITLEGMKNLYPDKSKEELLKLLKKVCDHFGTFIVEGWRVIHLTRENLTQRVKIEGMEHLEKAFVKKKGVIFATAHFGNFELANGAFALLGYPVWSVIREVDNPSLDRLLDSARCVTGLHVIKKESAAKEIIKHLRAGHIITVNIDQNAGFNNIFIPFFGKLAATFTTPAVMGARTGAIILPVMSFRDEATDTYTIRVYPEVKQETTGDRNADIRLVMMKLTATLEDAIRQAPEQWLWIHRRWKTKPDEKDLEAIKRETKIIDDFLASQKDMARAAN